LFSSGNVGRHHRVFGRRVLREDYAMRGISRFGILLLVASMASVPFAEAQTGSSLRGYVKDDQGGVLPGVTVTAKSPDIIQPATAVTDATGYYRLD
jgi:hypothetical protein